MANHISWDDYFMGIALLSAKRSKDPNTKVGACIVNSNNHIIAMGYNGFPIGCSDNALPWTKIDENPLNTKYPYVIHAEANAIVNRGNNEIKNCTLYTTLFPCNECTKLCIQSGIKQIVYRDDIYHNTWQCVASRKMLDMVGITYRRFCKLSLI